MVNLLEPSAQQIVEVHQEFKITCNEETLRKIFLNPEFKDKQVCVVSITGILRQGKSFFLNLLLQYLKSEYQAKKILPLKCLEQEDPTPGFPWKSGRDRHTNGIVVWPEIFVAKVPSGEEIAIVLWDTQGMSHSKKTPEDPVPVFTIATLLSSFQILNVAENLHEYDLALFEAISTKPSLQHLCLLIRDWPFQFEYDFGLQGGKELLERLHQSKNVTKKQEILRERIFKLFENISCYLLPPPGERVSPKFLQYVKEFVANSLTPENLAPKKIDGKAITVSDLYYLIQTFCQNFQEGKAPSIDEALLKAAYYESLEKYTNAMTAFSEDIENKLLEEHHSLEKLKVLYMFDDQTKESELKKTLKKKLKKAIEETFLKYRQTKRIMKQEKEREFAYHEQEKLLEKFESIQTKHDHMERGFEKKLAHQKEQYERTINEKLKMLEDEIKKVENKNEELRVTAERLTDERKKIDEENCHKEERQKKYEEKLGHQKEQYERTINEKLKMLEDEIKKVENKNEELRVTAERLTDERKKIDEENRHKEERQKKYEEKLAHQKEQYERTFNEKLKMLEDEIKKMENENEKLRLANKHLETVQNELKKEVEELSKTIEEANDEGESNEETERCIIV